MLAFLRVDDHEIGYFARLNRMEEKASDLEAENRMLRQAVASIPSVKSPSSENHRAHDLQVCIIKKHSIYNHDRQYTKTCLCMLTGNSIE